MVFVREKKRSRKQRTTLTPFVAGVLREWLAEHAGGGPYAHSTWTRGLTPCGNSLTAGARTGRQEIQCRFKRVRGIRAGFRFSRRALW